MNVTIRKSGVDSIDIPLVEQSGEILFSGDFGKPQLKIRDNGGTLYPRIRDEWSGQSNYTLVGRLFDYDKSHDLADLIATAEPNEPLKLDIPFGEYPSTVEVAPSAGAEQALSLGYPAGRKNNVDVELQLTRVSDTLGGITQTANTPRASGSGPITLSTSSGSVDIPTAALEVERGVGRPKDVVRRTRSDYPNYIVKPKVTFDEFSFSFQSIDNVPTIMTDIVDLIFETQLGNNPVKCNFNGLFGLGEISVIPTGSAPFRQLRQAGEKSTIISPTFSLRRVLDV